LKDSGALESAGKRSRDPSRRGVADLRVAENAISRERKSSEHDETPLSLSFFLFLEIEIKTLQEIEIKGK